MVESRVKQFKSDLPRRMVFVDDDPHMRDILRHIFSFEEEDEHFLVTCGSGKELILRIRELQPELLMLDLKMPEMDGTQTFEAFRALPEGEHVPVILVTGYRSVEMQDHFREHGVIGVIYKDEDFRMMPQKVSEIWKAHRNHNPREEHN